MKTRIYLAMNYWPNDEYWLCSEFKENGIDFRLIGINNKLRKLRYLRLFGNTIWNLTKIIRAVKIALGTKKDEIVIVQDDTASSVFIAMLLRIFFKSNYTICLNMMDNLKSNFLKKNLYKYAFKHMYASTNNRNVSDLYCNLYHLPQDKFFYLPDCISNWGMNILKNDAECQDKGYIFSGGSSYRDWDLFIDVAKKLPACKFVGIARKSKFPNTQLPPNLEMHFDVNELVFNKYLRDSRIVFMPINVKTQGGQIVIFTSGLYHKPIVTTSTAAIKTYIENGRNGLLCEFKDTKSAIQAIEKLMVNNDLRERLGEELYNDVSKLTPSHFVNLLFKFLKTKNIYQ